MNPLGRRVALLFLALAAIGCGERGPLDPDNGPDDPGNGDGNGNTEQGIVGTWDIVSVNGTPVAIGSLRWVFTETEYTAITAPCTEAGTYTYDADILRATTTALEGEDCAGEVGATAEYEVTVDETTLTALIPDLQSGGTSTFIFIRP